MLTAKAYIPIFVVGYINLSFIDSYWVNLEDV